LEAGGCDASPEEAGTVVPEVELPEGALPVSAAWLSGVGRVASASGGGGSVPASSPAARGEPDALSALVVWGLSSARRASSLSGVEDEFDSGGFLGSSVIAS
jgi:hypothetical protein